MRQHTLIRDSNIDRPEVNRILGEGSPGERIARPIRPSLADYWASVEEFCRLCQRELPDRFVSCIIVGSLSTGDIVPGWSDVDAYLVLDAAKDDSSDRVSALIDNVTRKFPWLSTDRGSLFSVIPVTRLELLEGGPDVSFLSQWDIKRHGIVSCGEDLRPFVPEPKLDEAWIDRNTDWMISYLEREKESTPYWRARNAIGFIMNGARNAVIRRGAYAKAKEELANTFEGLYPERVDVLRSAMNHRAHWPLILENVKAVAAVYEQSMDFLRWIGSPPKPGTL